MNSNSNVNTKQAKNISKSAKTFYTINQTYVSHIAHCYLVLSEFVFDNILTIVVQNMAKKIKTDLTTLKSTAKLN